MFNARRLSMVAVLAALAQPAFALDGVAVVPVDVSSGYFQADACVPEADPKLINECICKADIRKARIMGLAPAIGAVIDNQLAQVPEQMATESCAGKPVSAPAGDISINNVSATFEMVYDAPKVMSVLVTYTTFGAGAAHPSTGTEGYTFDLNNGKTINPTERLTVDQRAKANEFVQAELVKKYGDTLLEETKARTEPYLTESTCENCTIYYTKEGWNVRFQLYAVAPYVAGQPTVVIPTTLIPDPETLIAGKK